MEAWEIEFQWLKVRHFLKDSMQLPQLPDLNGVLLLIGVQELGHVKNKFTKEEKQDLMHIAVCSLLSNEGYYEFVGRDADGWPHFKQLRPIAFSDAKAQEALLQRNAIAYLRAWTDEDSQTENG